MNHCELCKTRFTYNKQECKYKNKESECPILIAFYEQKENKNE